MSFLDKYCDPIAAFFSRKLYRYPFFKKKVRLVWLFIRKIERIFIHQKVLREIRGQPEKIKNITEAIDKNLKGDGKEILFYGPSIRASKPGFHSFVWLVVSWALKSRGHTVYDIVCEGELGVCMMGIESTNIELSPNCHKCRSVSQWLHPNKKNVHPLKCINIDEGIKKKIVTISYDELKELIVDDVPIGKLVLPSVRWRLRCYHIEKFSNGIQLYREYLLSASKQVRFFKDYFKGKNQADSIFVTFNATFYPEAIASYCAKTNSIKTVSFESGHYKHSITFSHDIVTKYSIEVPKKFTMNDEQNEHLNNHFQKKALAFFGNKADIPTSLKVKKGQFRKMVTVFTNVAFDTSQVWADRAFENIFSWLKETLSEAKKHPEILFTIRAHPHEEKISKQSQEPFEKWIKNEGFYSLPNIYFIGPNSPINSYALLDHSDFCLLYNSTIGLEAVALGKEIICGGWPKYASSKISTFFNDKTSYLSELRKLLSKEKVPLVSLERKLMARRYFYFLMFRSSLKFSHIVREPIPSLGFVLKDFSDLDFGKDLTPELQIICDGITNNRPFFY